jgi:hypothetical protein
VLLDIHEFQRPAMPRRLRSTSVVMVIPFRHAGAATRVQPSVLQRSQYVQVVRHGNGG